MVNSFSDLDFRERTYALQLFNELLQNEQQKAMQAVHAHDGGNCFGGTSISALIISPELENSLSLKSYEELAESIANIYIQEARILEPKLKKSFTKEECELFEEHGVFYGVHVSPKLLGLVENLTVDYQELLLKGFPDPYELPKSDPETIEKYFQELERQKGISIDIKSIVLADSTTPHGYEGKKILNPSQLNQKLCELSELIGEALENRKYKVDPIYLISTDTDSPHRALICEQKKPIDGFPLTPGLTMCGSTATIEGFDFLYMYRLGLISQIISNNIVSSKMKGKYTPFVFFGMLSPYGYINGAIPTKKMGVLRYEGDINLREEFLFQFDKKLRNLFKQDNSNNSQEENYGI